MANYTLEGIEAKGKSEVNGTKFMAGDPPPFSEEDRQKKACEHQMDEADVEYKYGSDGRKLSIGNDGKWNIKRKDWRPWEVPYEYWKSYPELHGTWREMFPDANRGPDVKANEGILEGDITVPEGEEKEVIEVLAMDSEPSDHKKSYWTEDGGKVGVPQS